jgi:hypothetical protein
LVFQKLGRDFLYALGKKSVPIFKQLNMKKNSKSASKHPVSRKQSEKGLKTGKKESELAASATNQEKFTKTGRNQGHNPPSESTKGNKMKAGKPYKQQ